ncbi:MAG: BCCT family transporter [Gammaproteobacteria bacterium]|tara:strand:+ start:6437 stop:7912 length:1476 start_codon:yes stop_codon:yes gene_type:complete
MINIKLNPLWSKTVLVITFSFLLILSSYVLLDPDGSAENLLKVYSFFSKNFESFFLFFGFMTLVILIIIAFSPAGSGVIKLEGRTNYSYFSWYSMLFATGMGAALLYWSTYEWLVYYTDPIENNDQTLLVSRSYPLFHWMFTGWALYILPTVAFVFSLMRNINTPLTFSGILLKKQSGILRIVLDVFFIGAILTGAGVGLALSFPLMSAAISKIFNLNQTIYLDFLMLFVCMCIVSISVYRGLENGIKKLSNFNIILVIIFLFLVLIIGPTKYIIVNTLEPVSYVIKNYLSLSLVKSKYSLDWTVFYWAWYIALAPAVGAFIVNISNNKTIRELIFGALIVGSLGCILHIGILSNISIYFYENGTLNAPEIFLDQSLTSHALVIETISSLNFGNIFLILFAIIAVVFLCTTYDSLSYILASASMKNFKDTPSKNLRVFFAIILMIQPALIMFLGGKDAFMWLLVIISVPLMFIYIFLIISIFQNAIKFKKS